MNATVSKRVIKVYIQSAIELFGSFSERAGNHKNFNIARITPAFLPKIVCVYKNEPIFRSGHTVNHFFHSFKNLDSFNVKTEDIDSRTYSSISFSARIQFKLLFKT